MPQIYGSDYRELSAAALGQLKKANDGARAHHRCDDKVISDYAKAQ